MRRLEEQLSKVAFVPAGFEAFVLDAEIGVSILFEPREGDVTQHGQVLAGRGVAHARRILAKGHIEAPMQLIPVLAYQFVQLIRRRLRAQGITDSWSTLRATLGGQCRVTATFRRPDGRALHVRKTTQAEAGQLRIYQALGLDPSPGRVKKMLV